MLNLARILFLIVALVLFSFTIGVLPGQEPVIEGYSFWFGIFFAVAVLLVIFRTQGLADTAKKDKKPTGSGSKSDKTPAQVMKEVSKARMQMIGVFIVPVIIVLIYFGIQPPFEQMTNWISAKGPKIIDGLFH